MSTTRFQIDKYQVTIGADLPSIQTNKDAKIVGIIGCYGKDQQLMINFVEGFDFPDAQYDETKRTGAIYVSASLISAYVDILRNEKPLFALCNTENPEWSNISTEHEPVGEGERR